MAKAKRPLTLGDLGKKISSLRTNQVLYSLLLIAVFALGYLLARVQVLENGGVGGGSKDVQVAQQALAQIANDTSAPQAQAVAQQALAKIQNPEAQAATPAPAAPVKVENGHFPVEGKDDAKVTIVEFSDFECPFCEQFYTQTLSQIRKDYVDTGKAKIYFRHFPLSFHPAANPAALASECANEQGSFWQYHDKVFSNQSKISGGGDAATSALKQFAADLGLNASQFNNCFDTAKYQKDIDKDVADGQAAGVSGTPTFYINGKQIVGAQPYASFKAMIDAELKS